MSKRKMGLEGFGFKKKQSFEFEAMPAPKRLYLPSPKHRAAVSEDSSSQDHDLDHVQYESEEDWQVVRETQRVGPTSRRSGGQDSSNDGEGYQRRGQGGGERVTQEEEIDPLDAFMESIHEEVEKAPIKGEPKLEELGEDEDDPVESYLRSHRVDSGLALAATALHAGYESDEEVYAAAKAVDNGTVEYDSDDNPIVTISRKKMDALPELDHSDIDYPPFNKNLYEESASISMMSEEDVASYRGSLAIRVSGFGVSRPVKNFDEVGFDPPLIAAIAKQGYENPTPIQCQTFPVAMCGRDMIGVAKTGSGKTAAYVLPLIVHIMNQSELEAGEGPIGVICSPTRELAQQICSQAKKFAKIYGIRVAGVYGGTSKFEQIKELKAGCEIVVATPGRLIDMLKTKVITMQLGTYLILDEADQMFDLGFEPQVRSIIGQMRPDRQTMLFSATMPRRVERLAREVLSDPIRVTVGEAGSANEDITQIVTVLPSDGEKLPWLINKLSAMVDDGDTLIFASTKIRVEDLESKLKVNGFKIAALHGDKDQASRMDVLRKFKSGEYHVLVATDVAARGLDIKSIKTVVNFDIAKDMDGHVHRIGRTGRAGDKDGVAHTLIVQKEARFAGDLVKSLITAGQVVPIELMDLAMKDSRFRTQREGHRLGGGKGRGRGRGGVGGGVKSGGGRSVRGVDFGLGIGYNADAANKSSQTSNKPKQVLATPTISRVDATDALKVGMMARFKNSFVAASRGAMVGGPGSAEPGTTRNSSRGVPWAPSGAPTGDSKSDQSQTKERARQRRRPSGWDQ